jgi:sugar phosphate isomerase/epimerase
MRRIGFALQASSTTAIPDIKKAMNAGFNHIELKWNKFTRVKNQKKLISSLSKLDWFRVSLSLHTPLQDVNIGSLKEIERKQSIKHIIEAIGVAKDLNADFIVFHAGKIPAGSLINQSAKTKAFMAQEQSISEIITFCQELGIIGALENGYSLTDHGLVTTIDDMARVAGSVAGVTFLLDIGHFILNSPLTDIQKQITNNPNLQFTGIHLHDNKRISDTHLPLGEGVLLKQEQELQALLKRLNTCPVIIECLNLASALKTQSIFASFGVIRELRT